MRYIRRHTLTLGLSLMFALTWPFYAELGLFVGYGLSIACLIVTALAMGRVGTTSLLRRFLLWRVEVRWYLVSFLGPFALYGAAIALGMLLGGARPDFTQSLAAGIFGASSTPWLYLVPFFLVDVVTNGEELAWRGFVLPRYQARTSALRSSLIVGLIWGFWHLPRFTASGDIVGFAFAMAHNVAIAVLFTWLYNGTGGSLLLATLLHAGLNTAYVFLPVASSAGGGSLVQVTVLAVEYLAALTVVGALGPASLSRRPPVREPASANPRCV